MLGSYQSKSLLQGARRGAVADELGSSYVPALASGQNFGRSGLTRGWQAQPVSAPPTGQQAGPKPRAEAVDMSDGKEVAGLRLK